MDTPTIDLNPADLANVGRVADPAEKASIQSGIAAQEQQRQQQLAETKAKMDASTKQIQEQRAGLSSQEAALGDQYKQQEAALGAPPEMPAQQFHVEPQQASKTFNLLMIAGALGGALTKGHMNNAMNNMTAIMKGQMEGDAQKTAAAKEEFKTNFDAGMARFKEYSDRKKQLDTEHKNDIRTLREERRMLDLEYGVDMKQHEAWSKDMSKGAVDSQGLMIKMQKSVNDMSGSNPHLSEDAKQYSAEMQLLGGDGFKPSGRKDVTAMQAATFEKMVNLAKERHITPAQLVSNKAIQKSIGQTLSAQMKISTGQEKIGDKLELDMKSLNKLIDSGDAGSVRLMNTTINKMRDAFSDPTLAPFALQANLVANEFERLMVGNGLSVAMLPVAAQENAQKLLSRDMSPAEIRSVFPVMLNDLKNTIDANRKTQESLINKMTGGEGGIFTGDTPPFSPAGSATQSGVSTSGW
jgi:hypothetical protein